ncbi:hypothetical protein [Vibrio taketomensis]|uniref:hypothetical protein n=1 Tax=Vibrio taketomensis TaxID=2572923 RepID=UPI001E5C5E5A|nr:hypothetical protein [Vibrio taketomensis]
MPNLNAALGCAQMEVMRSYLAQNACLLRTMSSSLQVVMFVLSLNQATRSQLLA